MEASRGTRSKCFDSTQRGGCRFRGGPRPGTALSFIQVLHWCVVFLFVLPGCATWRGRFVEYQHVCHGGAVAMGRCGASGCDVSERDVNAPILRSEGLSRHQQDALLPCPTPMSADGDRVGFVGTSAQDSTPLCRRLMVIPGLPRSRGGSVNSGADPGAKNAPGNSSSDGMSVLRRAFERRSEHVAPRPRYPIRWPRPR